MWPRGRSMPRSDPDSAVAMDDISSQLPLLPLISISYVSWFASHLAVKRREVLYYCCQQSFDSTYPSSPSLKPQGQTVCSYYKNKSLSLLQKLRVVKKNTRMNQSVFYFLPCKPSWVSNQIFKTKVLTSPLDFLQDAGGAQHLLLMYRMFLKQWGDNWQFAAKYYDKSGAKIWKSSLLYNGNSLTPTLILLSTTFIYLYLPSYFLSHFGPKPMISQHRNTAMNAVQTGAWF